MKTQWREMAADDVPAVVAIIDSHDEDDAEAAAEDFNQPSGTWGYFVLTNEDQVVGVTGLQVPPGCDKTAWVSWTYIDAELTGQGLGRTMLNHLLDYAKTQGYRLLCLKMSDYVDPEDGPIYAAAAGLYQSLGFDQAAKHANFYDQGESQIILTLRLTPITTLQEPEQAEVGIEFSRVFQLAETEACFTFAWDEAGDEAMTVDDLQQGLNAAKEDDASHVFLSFPSSYAGVHETLLAAGFERAGQIPDYYEDGVHENQYRFVC